MGAAQMKQLTAHMRAIAAAVPLGAIGGEADYTAAVDCLNELLDAGSTDESHPLAAPVALLGERIAAWEQSVHPLAAADGVEVLRFLLAQHGLTQADLPEVGSQGVVSEILAGKRRLNVRQIEALAARFGTSPAVFLAGPPTPIALDQ